YHKSEKSPAMSQSSTPDLGINSWFEEEQHAQYLRDRSTVDESWKRIFEQTNGAPAPAAREASKPATTGALPAPPPPADASLQALRGAPARIAENMSASLSIP